MKKRIVSILLLLTIVCTSLVSLAACGKEEPVEEAYEETVEVEVNSDVPNITEMSKAEILSLTPAEIKESVETYLPNYKEIYRINKDMTDDDWKALASIICVQLYGSATIESTASTEEEVNDIYTTPTYADIEPMTLSDFAVYMNTAIDKEYGETYRTENNIDYTTLSEEQLQEEKDNLLKTLE